MIKKCLIILLVLSIVACGSKPSSDDNASTKSVQKSSKKDCKKSKSDSSDTNKSQGQGRGNKKDDECEEKIIINVEADSVYQGDAVSVFRTTTILEADLESAVTSKASGIVLELHAEVGDKVEAGDVLAVLESEVQQLNYESANANYQKSLNNYERAKSLLTKGLANKESVENLKFETRSLKTKLSQAELDLEFTKIKAPISGVITKRNIKKGNLIQLNTQVYEIVDFDSLQAVINVPEDRWILFKKGLEVNFTFNSFSDIIKGSILRIDPIVDSSTGTFKVVMQINDQQKLSHLLRPGLFGKTEIVIDKHANTLLLSKNAVIREDETAYVYEINEDNTLTKREITIGYEMDDTVEVLSGLDLNNKVVTTGKNNVTEDSTVEVIDYND